MARGSSNVVLGQLFAILACSAFVSSTHGALDSWRVVVQNCGINAMHMTTMHTDRVVMFDRTDWGYSPLKLPNGRCRNNPNDTVTPRHDCTAHSIQYDPATNTVRALFIFSDTFCSAGAFYPNGTLQQAGGDHSGDHTIRRIGTGPYDDWVEQPNYLFRRRWYATSQILPDGDLIVIGGTGNPSYEYVPKRTQWPLFFPFLANAYSSPGENNLYPFVHLTPSGHLFVFANVYSILFDYQNTKIIKTFPNLGTDPRVYPYSGTSVMLPLTAADNFTKVEILICGGAPLGSFTAANASAPHPSYWPALNTCGRMDITAPNPKWNIETMPSPRVMCDGMLLPTGEVLIINGAKAGLSGWNANRDPALFPFLYNPSNHTFSIQSPTSIPRMYHSSANVQADGTVLIGGSNDQGPYTFTGVPFPTELRLEKYSPYYLNAEFDAVRLTITLELKPVKLGATFVVSFTSPSTVKAVQVSLYAPSFTTHANSMNQRMVVLDTTPVARAGAAWQVTATAPSSGAVTPPGWYMCTALNRGVSPAIPSKAAWVQITP
jgi:hypothetical protein